MHFLKNILKTGNDEEAMDEEQMNRMDKDLLKVKNASVTNAEKENTKQSDEKETEQEGEKHVVNGKDKEMKKETEEGKCSPERVMKDAEGEKREESAKKKAIYNFFGEHF